MSTARSGGGGDGAGAPIEVLGGGIANAGSIFRHGSVVYRPAGAQTASVQRLMRRLRETGVTTVPEPLGIDGDGHERVRFVEGRTATDSDDWAAGDTVLRAVAAAQRQLHDAARTLTPSDLGEGPWGGAGYIPTEFLPPAFDGVAIACHNDLCVANVVFSPDADEVAGIIDWDYARPVDPLFDIAVALRHWLPMSEPADRSGAWAELDTQVRFAMWSEICGLDRSQQRRVLDIAVVFLDRAHVNIADLAARNVGGFRSLVEGGYLARNRRDRNWIVTNHQRLTNPV